MAKKQKFRKLLRSALWDIGEGEPVTSTQPAASVTLSLPTMTCVVCGRQEQAWGRYAGDWRTVPYHGHVYFTCPSEWPSADESPESHQEAYQKILEFIGGLPNERQH